MPGNSGVATEDAFQMDYDPKPCRFHQFTPGQLWLQSSFPSSVCECVIEWENDWMYCEVHLGPLAFIKTYTSTAHLPFTI